MRIFKEVVEWFDLPNDPDKARIKIKYLNAGEAQEIIAKSRKLQFDISADEAQSAHMVPDEILLRNKTACARIVDWENFYDDKGNKLECNDRNKVWFSQQDGFMEILKDLTEKIDKVVEKEKEKEEKNLPSSQDGSAA